MSMFIEDHLPIVKYQGLKTQKAVDLSLAPTTALAANTTVGGVTVGQASVVASGGATVTLTAAQSGGTFLMDAATGITYTLPAPVAGLMFSFLVSVAVTSNNHIVVTDATGTHFILGAINEVINNSATTKAFVANGTSNSTITMNGTTTGGLQGTVLNFTAISSTVWYLEGQIVASGTLATPIT